MKLTSLTAEEIEHLHHVFANRTLKGKTIDKSIYGKILELKRTKEHRPLEDRVADLEDQVEALREKLWESRNNE